MSKGLNVTRKLLHSRFRNQKEELGWLQPSALQGNDFLFFKPVLDRDTATVFKLVVHLHNIPAGRAVSGLELARSKPLRGRNANGATLC